MGIRPSRFLLALGAAVVCVVVAGGMSTVAAQQSLTATLLSPSNGQSGVPLSGTFRWSTVSNAQAYQLYVGTSLGARDFLDTGQTTSTSRAYSGLQPGRKYYARLRTRVAGIWRSVDSTFTALVEAAPTIKINEVESSGGVPGDWVELYNFGSAPANIAGLVFKDNDPTHAYAIPAGTTIPAGGYYLLEEAAFGFGLGSADSARILTASGTVLDSYTWTTAAATTYGRCANGTGAFVVTAATTKGTVNACPPTSQPWPGSSSVQTADGLNVFGGNLSGLAYQASGSPAPGVLWAVRNGPGSLFRLVWNGSTWTPDTANSWSAGKSLRYPGGTGSPDAEGVTFAGPNSSGGIYVATERDNNASATSRNSILRFNVSATGTTLTATNEWNLTANLPGVGANVGLEAIAWLPDDFLVARGFVDETGGPSYAYNPANYPNHGTGLFFVALEATGTVYAYALNHVTGGFTRIATISTGLSGVMDLTFDPELGDLWAVCDDTCSGRSAVLRVGLGTGLFGVARLFDRPGGMPNLNNEGFAIAPLAECVADRRPAFWADDAETSGHAIRRGTVTCSAF